MVFTDIKFFKATNLLESIKLKPKIFSIHE